MLGTPPSVTSDNFQASKPGNDSVSPSDSRPEPPLRQDGPSEIPTIDSALSTTQPYFIVPDDEPILDVLRPGMPPPGKTREELQKWCDAKQRDGIKPWECHYRKCIKSLYSSNSSTLL